MNVNNAIGYSIIKLFFKHILKYARRFFLKRGKYLKDKLNQSQDNSIESSNIDDNIIYLNVEGTGKEFKISNLKENLKKLD